MLDTGAQAKQSSSESNVPTMDVPSAGSAESGSRTTFSSAGPLPPVANAGAMAGPSASDLAFGGAEGGQQVQNAAAAVAPQATEAAGKAKAGGNNALADAQEIAKQGIAAMSGSPGVVVNHPPAEMPAQAGMEEEATPGGGLAVKPEAGVVGSLQLEYDMCTGRLALIGWIWAGAGAVVQTPIGKQWWGAYTFLEGTICETTLDFMPKLPHGPKPPASADKEKHGAEGGWGIAGFPINLAPGKMGKFKQAGLEVGVLITPDGDGNGASVELIALLDVLGYLGPVAAGAKKAVEAANKLASKVGLSVEMAAGIDASGTVHGWRSPNGLVVDSAKIAGGGFVAMGIGLPHSKGALPGK